ncbi:MAG: FAD binding domain-containing protein [Planctomycetes bacterium]|nr:FAD binding domain-containing protein [Planctomycetota bacterium]
MKVACPTTLAEAISHKALGFTPVAGATDLWAHWPVRTANHDLSYVDLSGLHELRGIAWSAEHLTLGALTTYWDTMQDSRVNAEFPLLIAAARYVGAIQIQSRGTWAGNIANGSPAADGVPALMALDARVRLVGSNGERTVPLDRFYTGYRATVMGVDELITAILVPRRTYSFTAFEKVGPRRAQAITKVGFAVAHSADGWRVVANSMAATVRRCPSLEAILNASHPNPPAEPDLRAAASKDLAPISDIRSTAEYRTEVFARLLRSTLATMTARP